jgi:sigma-B regulation protein RsbU (phosphoserine phosphatase)
MIGAGEPTRLRADRARDGASGIHGRPSSHRGPLLALHGIPELGRTEMFLQLFYGMIDFNEHRLTFANAGHPHAFRVDGATGEATRLEATRPPLGVEPTPGQDHQVPWRPKRDILCLFTDGIVDAAGESNPGRFGEDRVLAHVSALRQPARISKRFTPTSPHSPAAAPSDDRTWC